jgi:acetylornithine deacetylase/succinyl-diaminopimelate desuccinylase-like protein
MDLVQIPSPSGEEAEVSGRLSEALAEAGMDVVLDHEFPESPNVIGRLRFAEGRTLQLDGHTDTVSQPHPPPRIDGGRLYGRGTADMKAGLAAVVEAARVLRESGLPLRGDLLVTAHGQHEDPVPPHELHAPMLALFRKGVLGDAAVIAEGPSHEMVVAGKGLSSFEVVFRRPGAAVHEIPWRERLPNPILAAHRFIGRFEELAQMWATRPDPLLGPESVFIGVLEGGDYFNRIPTRCRVAGSRRYTAERTGAEVEAELRALAADAAGPDGLEAEVSVTHSGQGFWLDPAQEIVRATRWAYQEVTGREQPLVGMSLIANASQFNTIARVPTVYHGVDQTTAHSDLEHVAIEDIVRTARVLAATAVAYLGVDERT